MNGIALIDKPAGITSRRVVDDVGRALRCRKAGHLGTLDPFATGLLIIMLGRATRVAPFLETEPKEYQATMLLGQETDTQDLTGRIIKEVPQPSMGEEEIVSAFAKFRGKIIQTPPMFSAIKHRGVALYKLARRGVDVPRKGRQVEIFELVVGDVKIPHVSFRVTCSGGTYIRTLAVDVGRELGCGAHLTALRRVRSGKFRIDDCLGLEEFRELARREYGDGAIISLNQALGHLKGTRVSGRGIERIGRGQGVEATELVDSFSPRVGERLRLTSGEGELVALGEVQDGGLIRPLRVFI